MVVDPIHQRARTDDGEWFTPPEIFDALGCRFDLDPCSPGPNHWVPADKVYTKADDGLAQPWEGFVYMNPPYGGRSNRNGVVPWIKRFVEHGDGIACVSALTSAGWFQDWVPQCDGALFPRGKTKFYRDGTQMQSPAGGIVLLSSGRSATAILQAAAPRMGLFVVF